jgi:hypothetical protein
MGVFSGSEVLYMDDTYNTLLPVKDIRVGRYIMTDMSTSKIYFKSKGNNPKVLRSFTIQNAEELSELTVTNNHIMLRVIPEAIVSHECTSSSDTTPIPEMLKCDYVPARELKVGDMIPRWSGNFGIIVGIEHKLCRSVQIMTNNGLLMIDKNILTCYVEPYLTIKRLSGPVKHLSGVSTILVAKPFYYIPEKIYNFGLDHFGQ